jgi:hypothetical protein
MASRISGSRTKKSRGAHYNNTRYHHNAVVNNPIGNIGIGNVDAANAIGNKIIERKEMKDPCTNMTNYGKLKPLNINSIDEKDIFRCIINKNVYVDGCFADIKKDTNSFYHLVDRELSHGDAIKLGVAIEKIFRDIINLNQNLNDIKQQTQKGKKEKDHLFIDKGRKIIYYAEVKGNLTLDTEKRRATKDKMNAIVADLQSIYPDYEIKKYLFAPRYYKTSEIPESLKKNYRGTEFADFIDCFIGVNDYLKELGILYQFPDEHAYKAMVNDIAHRLFFCYSFKELEKEGIDRTAIAYSIMKPLTEPPQLKYKSKATYSTARAEYLANIRPIHNNTEPLIPRRLFEGNN